jgi:hypothetical protein
MREVADDVEVVGLLDERTLGLGAAVADRRRAVRERAPEESFNVLPACGQGLQFGAVVCEVL